MKSPAYPKGYRLLIAIGSLLLIVIAVGASISLYVEHEIEENIQLLHGKFSSIHVNLFTRSITAKDVEWSSDSTSTNSNPHFLKLTAITANGISLYELLVNKTILIKDVIIDSGAVQYIKNLKQTGQKINGSEFKHFRFENISVHYLQGCIKTDTIESYSGVLNGHVGEATIFIDSMKHLSYSIGSVDADVKKLNIKRKEGMYGGTIARLHINTLEQKVTIDSAQLIPNFGKYEFAQHLGKQTARMDLSIPHLTIAGLQFDKLIDSSFVASKIEIKTFSLLSFKDKRIPFVRKENVPLPMVSFLKLPFHVKVDSIIITNSLITIEEFPEHGIKTGTVTFEDVNATLTRLDNRQKTGEEVYAHLNASALLMGEGKVKTLFQLPLDGSSSYTAKGYISNMSFKKLNPVLTSMANVRVESGYLKDLTFDFRYTEFTSKGTINIDYENLQLIRLNTNKRSTNEIKTFFINAFVKNERSKSPSPAKKNGVIDIERDRKRYIFNVWLKSILNGLKSSILG